MVLVIPNFMLELWSKLALHFHYTSNYTHYYPPDYGITQIVSRIFLGFFGLFGCSAYLAARDLPQLDPDIQTIPGHVSLIDQFIKTMILRLSELLGVSRQFVYTHRWCAECF